MGLGGATTLGRAAWSAAPGPWCGWPVTCSLWLVILKDKQHAIILASAPIPSWMWHVSVLAENPTPYSNVRDYKGSNGCHHHGLPLTNRGIQGKRRITRSPGTTPTPPITTIAQLRLHASNNTIELCINTNQWTHEHQATLTYHWIAYMIGRTNVSILMYSSQDLTG
jgi:hypothetical protein